MPRRKKNLNETGLQVSVCRHGIAQRAVNMFQGELYAYSLYLQRHHMQENSVQFMCIDIACKYWVWLEKHDRQLATIMKPIIGAMHSKKHQVSCQVNFNI